MKAICHREKRACRYHPRRRRAVWFCIIPREGALVRLTSVIGLQVGDDTLQQAFVNAAPLIVTLLFNYTRIHGYGVQ